MKEKFKKASNPVPYRRYTHIAVHHYEHEFAARAVTIYREVCPSIVGVSVILFRIPILLYLEETRFRANMKKVYIISML